LIIRHSLWTAPALIGLGFLTWTSFLYIGIRARRRSWIICGIAYLIGIIIAIVLFAIDPGTNDSDPATSGPAGNVGTALVLVIWLGGTLHALIINRTRLRLLASHDSQSKH
jgi:hypothetical protein